MNIFAAIVVCSFFTSLFAEPDIDHNIRLADEYCVLADHYEQLGNKNKAMELFKKALRLHASNPQALVKLANYNYAHQDTDDAIQNYVRAVQEKPQDPHLHYNLGLCYQKKEEWQKAAEQFSKTIEIDSHHIKAHLHGAAAFEKLDQHNNAIALLEKAVSLDSHDFNSQHQLGNLYRHVERIEDAIIPYQKALALQPDNIHVMMDLANALNMLNRNEESLAMYEAILEKNPNVISALYNFGFTLKKMDKLDRALDVYQQVLSKKADYAPVHFSLSSIYLSLGDYEKGLEEYEWRWKNYGENIQKFNIPVWAGEDLSHKRLLIYAEQGLGDTFQFIRYVKLLKEKYPGIHIVFETQQSLTELLRLQPYFDQVVPRKSSVPYCNYQIPLLSIPWMVKTRLETIPSPKPYITASPERIAYWRSKISKDTNFKIGICWQGNARYSTQALRRAVASKSMSLEDFKPIADIPGVSLYVLQRVDGLDQVESCSFKDKLITFDKDFDSKYGGFMDTAAVAQHLDLVVSVDTGVCHICAGLGVPTWIVLPFPADWRWLRNRSDSPWYESVTLFRQTANKDWSIPMQEIAHDIRKKLNLTKTTITRSPNYYEPSEEQQQFFDQLLLTIK